MWGKADNLVKTVSIFEKNSGNDMDFTDCRDSLCEV